MTTPAQLRKGALALPETVEVVHSGITAFSLKKTEFASLVQDGLLQLLLTDDDADAALAAHPTAERWAPRGTPIGIRLPLAGINGRDLNWLLRRSWLSCAPKRLAMQLEAADSGTAPHSLPAIGGPATRGLLSAGMTDLDTVARHSQDELLALHGVGPKAVRILTEALAASGQSLRGDG
ncbi:MAG TPA: hypothetical protein VN601_09830 [Arthrobacter sp.]|nr:hypothetical protein [Arthrobacter sp.]